MKVRVVQPEYSVVSKDLDKQYGALIELMNKCDEPLDIIVMPEWCEISAAQTDRKGYVYAIEKYNADFMKQAKALAKRCNAITFVNCADKVGNNYRNTTHVIDRMGKEIGKYYKAHLAPKEGLPEIKGGIGIDDSYSVYDTPYTITIEGIKFAFLTCYDFYMYEEFSQIARENVDIIIGCSHQRTDTHDALSLINRFLCYNTNAYLIRASVSLGKDSNIGGCSCVIKPNGEVLLDMKNEVGFGTCEIDPNDKYFKSAGFNGVKKSHWQYIEDGRRPWLYRNGGASVVKPDAIAPYPRICAHRGFNTIAPENSMPAFGAAVALGAEEIEFDLWTTKDGVIVSCHDETLDRVSDGTGKIGEHTYEELLKLDFGAKHGEKFKGLKICTFEEILKKFAGRVIMNIHVKIWDVRKEDDKLKEIVSLIKKYDCEKYVYFMSGNDEALKKSKKLYPEIAVCVGAGKAPWDMVERAIDIGAEKVQLFKPYFNQQMINKAHEHGIRCNVFWSDEPEEAQKFIDMGIDCILTNDYLSIKNALKK